MKKEYFKPEITEMNLVGGAVMNSTSKLPVNPDITEKPLSNESRGEWGNVWGN